MDKQEILDIIKGLEIIENSDDYEFNSDKLDDLTSIIYSGGLGKAFEFDFQKVENDDDIRGVISVFIPNLYKGQGFNVIIDNSAENIYWENYEELVDRLLEREKQAVEMLEYFKL